MHKNIREGYVDFYFKIVFNMMIAEKKNPKKEIIDHLIIRYTDGSIGQEEMQLLERWVKESEENLKYYRQFRKLFDNSNPTSVNPGLALEKVLGLIGNERHDRSIISVLQKVAAILFIPLVISMLILIYVQSESRQAFENKMKTIETSFGSVSSFALEDGSKVWLNSGSSIQVPMKFSKDERRVKLNGEAYFEVQSNNFFPFIVQTDNFSVEATGTRFNVMAYLNQRPSVTLAEGRVIIHAQMKNKNQRDIPMLPGQHLSIDTENLGTSVEQGDVYKYYAWKDGKLVFRNDQLADIIQRISLQYNADIEITNASILQNRYRATFEDESLTEVLDLLKLASPFSYHEIPSTSLPDGSFSRRKIIITTAK